MKHHRCWIHPFLTLAILLSSLAFSLARVQPVSAQSGTWYVSTLGSDDNTCNAPELPCLTINAAIAKAASGDTVKVAVGTYTAASGTAVVVINKSITLSGGWDEGFMTQDGRSTIDGGSAGRGIGVTSNSTAVVELFIISNGFDSTMGGGIYNSGSLTLSNSIVSGNVSHWMGGGIYNDGKVTINDSTISGNIAGNDGSGGGGGGGIENYETATLNNSTVNDNQLWGGYYGSGIDTVGTLILNNSTVSGNTGGYGEGIYSRVGTIILNNSTITKNQSHGAASMAGNLTLQNTIIAGNGAGGDCYKNPNYHGTVTSLGYNLIGDSTGCSFKPITGDLVGTSSNLIDPKLGPLQDNGGPTFTHALLGNSPALNAGNPAEPGSGGNACLPTDQRGVARPEGSRCDIGAYEGYLANVTSIKRLNPSPIAASSVEFSVHFSEPVTGIDLAEPFSDFALTASGITDATIASVSGSGKAYTVTANTGSWSEDATIRLDLVDDDTILDSSGRPLGGTGAGNGNFRSGQAYTLKRISSPLSPKSIILDRTPTFKWTKIYEVEKYQLTLLRGTKVIYTNTVPASACGATQCTKTPTTSLSSGPYTWKVRAFTGGSWQSYSPAMPFKISPAKPGFWQGQGMEFYVTTGNPNVDNFAIYIRVTGCGNYKITYKDPVLIRNNQFSFKARLYANGTFSSLTKANGKLGLDHLEIPWCGVVTGGPFPWSAIWKNGNQPTLTTATTNGLTITLIPDLQLVPELQLPFDAFTVEPVE